eukprot:351683-Chlamydomonas_euryale.AAC.2
MRPPHKYRINGVAAALLCTGSAGDGTFGTAAWRRPPRYGCFHKPCMSRGQMEREAHLHLWRGGGQRGASRHSVMRQTLMLHTRGASQHMTRAFRCSTGHAAACSMQRAVVGHPAAGVGGRRVPTARAAGVGARRVPTARAAAGVGARRVPTARAAGVGGRRVPTARAAALLALQMGLSRRAPTRRQMCTPLMSQPCGEQLNAAVRKWEWEEGSGGEGRRRQARSYALGAACGL